MNHRIGFGGGCHWCTEAVFESLVGVLGVDQGWLAPVDAPEEFSEGVVVHFDHEAIDPDTLIAVHLHTHSCTSNHALRGRYRSAVYVNSAAQSRQAKSAISRLQADFDDPIITQVLEYGAFRGNDERYRHYYRQDRDRPFCKAFIEPKLKRLLERFGTHVKPQKGKRR